MPGCEKTRRQRRQHRWHRSQGSETASDVNGDLGVDSAKRYHMRLLADKPTYNKFKYRLTLNKESAREWAELKASSTSKALQLEEVVKKFWRVEEATHEHEAGTHQHRRTRCPRKRDAFHGSFDVEDPLALEVMMPTNTVEHKLNPKLTPDTNEPWPKCMWVLMTKETRHVKRRVADERSVTAQSSPTRTVLSRETTHKCANLSAPASPPVPTAAPTPPELL